MLNEQYTLQSPYSPAARVRQYTIRLPLNSTLYKTSCDIQENSRTLYAHRCGDFQETSDRHRLGTSCKSTSSTGNSHSWPACNQDCMPWLSELLQNVPNETTQNSPFPPNSVNTKLADTHNRCIGTVESRIYFLANCRLLCLILHSRWSSSCCRCNQHQSGSQHTLWIWWEMGNVSTILPP